MSLYICKVAHRTGIQPERIQCKRFYIEADCALAAYIKAQELTKGINNTVYPPEIEEYIPPKVDYTVTLQQMINEYGTKTYKETELYTRYDECRYNKKEKEREKDLLCAWER